MSKRTIAEWYSVNRMTFKEALAQSLFSRALAKSVKVYRQLSSLGLWNWVDNRWQDSVKMLNPQKNFKGIREFDLVEIKFTEFNKFVTIPIVRLEDMKEVQVIGAYTLRHPNQEMIYGAVLKKWTEDKTINDVNRDEKLPFYDTKITYLAVLIKNDIVLIKDVDYFWCIEVKKALAIR